MEGVTVGWTTHGRTMMLRSSKRGSRWCWRKGISAAILVFYTSVNGNLDNLIQISIFEWMDPREREN